MKVSRKDAPAWVREANRINRSARGLPPRRPRQEGPRVRREHPRAGSRYEVELQRLIELEGIPAPTLQHMFARDLGRLFRFDFAWPELKYAVEVDGGRWLVRRGKNGQPVPVGYHTHLDDYRKLNLAAKLGWKVMRFTIEMIRSGEAITDIKSMVASDRWGPS